jgi:virginiamycin B lyase
MLRLPRIIFFSWPRALVAAATLLLSTAVPLAYAGAAGTALSGHVTSPQGGPMEGVVVMATREGSTISISVVSQRDGAYSFPASRLQPGQYHLDIRAIGYAIAGPSDVTLRGGGSTTANLSLRRVTEINDEMTNAEWLLSMPGNDRQKGLVLNCTTCHTVERIVTSHFTAQDFNGVMHQMGLFANSASDYEPQIRLQVSQSNAATFGSGQATLAKFLASNNESAAGKLTYPLQTLPRPTGTGTRVLYTTYKLPRRAIQPHDVVADRLGRVWFSEFGDDFLGQLDPKTGHVVEYPIPTNHPKEPRGSLDLEFDQEGNLWLARMNQGGIVKFDYRTHKFKVYDVPKALRTLSTQQPMVGPQHWEVDGKVWMSDESLPGVWRMDLKTGQWQRWLPYGVMKGGGGGEYAFGRPHSVYGVYADKHNNLFFCDFAGENIGEVDAKTGKITLFPTPTPHSRPRRGQLDPEGRLWFGEWLGNKIGEFDTKTHKFKEWPIPVPFFAPYQVVHDKFGNVWAGGMSADRIVRLNPKTGQFAVYMLPVPSNIRHMFVDDSGSRPVLWIGDQHNGSVTRMEPLN